ncbi:MAG: ABC transporter ATP-binding protein [Lachnospiraceae bacterium]|nr:ABC transporter ATP-binding protein [Lachnospiraceae bacterium]
MIKINNIFKSYYGKTAIEDISLVIAPGQIQGLVGDNGAGKTTLIKCVAGIYKVDSGEITCEDKVIYTNPEIKEKIGYVSDNNDYIGRYTIKKMIDVFEIYFPKFSKDKFNEYNNRFKLDLDAKIDTLSKGQKMRLGLMLELAKNPEYLLLDEPTSGLDPVVKKAFMEIIIEAVEKDNVGVLISSHNLNDLEKLCDTITILEKGKVFDNSNLDELKGRLTKVQAVFENGVNEKLLARDTVVKYSNVGNVYTLVIEEYDSEKQKWLKNLGAGYIEELDMSLEELYIALEERKGEE